MCVLACTTPLSSRGTLCSPVLSPSSFEPIQRPPSAILTATPPRSVALASPGFGDVEVVTRRQDRSLPDWMVQLQRKGEKQELQRATVSVARFACSVVCCASFAERLPCG